MALTLNTIHKIQPVNSNLELIATESTATAATVYTFQVYINGALEATIKQRANPQLKAELNLSAILENYFSSQVFTNTSAITEAVPGGIVKYKVDVSTSTTVSTGELFVFNGVVQDFEAFSIDDYLMVSSSSKGKFLTKQVGPKKITEGSKSYLSVLSGTFGLTSTDSLGAVVSADPGFTGISVTIKQKNGTTRTASSAYTAPTANPAALLSVDVSPNRINALGGGQIDSQTLYYDVTEAGGKGYPVRYFIEREQKVQETFNILYTNSLGAVEHFDFTKVSTEQLGIQRSVFEQQNTRKPYNIEVQQQISVISDWMSELQSENLRDLWYSPAVKLHKDGRITSIILRTSGQTVKNRFNEKLINYTINFEQAAKYKTHKG